MTGRRLLTRAPSSEVAVPPPPPVSARCAVDAHLGPFELLSDAVGWLDTDWYTCAACRSTISAANALASGGCSIAPAPDVIVIVNRQEDRELALWALSHGARVSKGAGGLAGQWVWRTYVYRTGDAAVFVDGDGSDLPTLTPRLRDALRQARARREGADEALRACRGAP